MIKNIRAFIWPAKIMNLHTKVLCSRFIDEDVEPALVRKLQQIAVKIHQAMGCRDFSQYDCRSFKKYIVQTKLLFLGVLLRVLELER